MCACVCVQVVVPQGKKADCSLVEVGPRLCLQPIKIFAGSFGGPTLYENPAYTSPNSVRAMLKQKRAAKYTGKVEGAGGHGVII